MKRLICSLALLATQLAGQKPLERSNTALETQELNTALMHSTFMVSGPKQGAVGQTAFGTVFIIGVPLPTDQTRAAYTLVTAAHVLDDIGGESAALLMRTQGKDGEYSTFSYPIRIRAGATPLYVKHQSADVAAMYVRLPDNIPIALVTTDLLATDQRLNEIGIHPGDEAFCLGFPLAAMTPGGFPILRTGRIASFPLVPMASAKTWVFDLFLYPGNSGGPVYYIYDSRTVRGTMSFGQQIGILGLVIQQESSGIPEFSGKPLNLGIIVPATFIRETIERLPPPK